MLIRYVCMRCGNEWAVEKRKYAVIPNVFDEVAGMVCPCCRTTFKEVVEVDFDFVRAEVTREVEARSGKAPHVVAELPFRLVGLGNRSCYIRKALVRFFDELGSTKSTQGLLERVAAKLGVTVSEFAEYLAEPKPTKTYTFRVNRDLRRQLETTSSELNLPFSKLVTLALLYSYPELYWRG